LFVTNAEGEQKHKHTIQHNTIKKFKRRLADNATHGCVAQLAERRSLAGELTLSCSRPSANGWPLCG